MNSHQRRTASRLDKRLARKQSIVDARKEKGLGLNRTKYECVTLVDGKIQRVRVVVREVL